MNNTGLTSQQLGELKMVFARYPAVQQVKLYGSRAKGNFNAHSDIVLVAYGESLAPNCCWP